MARNAPAVDRAVVVLNLLAAHPGEKFTLSEIARDLSLNKATLHAILAALTRSGYIVRDPIQKSYGLGPALIALGTAALHAYPATDCAVPEMRALADELSIDVVASAAIGDEIVILEHAGTPRPFGIYVQPGQRIPLVPPLGTVFVAWSGNEAIERWLGKLGSKTESIKRNRAALASVRARGYSVGLERESQIGIVEALGRKRPALEERVQGMRTEEYALTELDPSASYRLNHIGAPVFGPSSEVALALFLIGFQGRLSAKQVGQVASRLLKASERVTKAIHGRPPPD
ncbi:MAG: IclR family transcriptional regulator [Actinomycetota bacterium]